MGASIMMAEGRKQNITENTAGMKLENLGEKPGSVSATFYVTLCKLFNIRASKW